MPSMFVRLIVRHRAVRKIHHWAADILRMPDEPATWYHIRYRRVSDSDSAFYVEFEHSGFPGRRALKDSLLIVFDGYRQVALGLGNLYTLSDLEFDQVYQVLQHQASLPPARHVMANRPSLPMQPKMIGD